jgi:ribA/ribD-fused uncharacterized protein
MKMAKRIGEFRGKYYFLSNFSSYPVTHDGWTYQNNEAAFQAMKVADRSKREGFTQLPPNKAKPKGRNVRLRPDWEQVKEQFMYEIVLAKFTQNDDLKQKLLDTGDALLIEGNTWDDTEWGVCRGRGQNKLGKILMRVRKELAA